MAVPRVRVPTPLRATAQLDARLSDEVEVYHRTYTTLLRSSGETLLRVLEPSHTAMNSSLHPLAASQEPDLGAFLYALRRLPMGVRRARRVVLGQEAEVFERAGFGRIEEWEAVEAPARRRRWFDSGGDVLAVLLASASDLDDLIPTLVAYQVEWNKLNALLKVSERLPGEVEPADCAELLGGSAEDWARLGVSWPEGLSAFLDEVAAHERNLRIRMLGGSNAGYARVTRRWWAPVRACLTDRGLADRPIYFISSNPHSIVNLVTKTAGAHADEVVAHVDEHGPDYLRDELAKFRAGRADGSWENFLYFAARGYYESQPEDSTEWERRARGERGVGVVHLSSRSALRVSAQVMQLDRLDPEGLDSRLGPIDAGKLARSDAVIVNVEYPLGVAAYNILREVAVAHETLRGVYVLGKAATLNADVGDVLISSVIHDEHSGTTYWLDNAFSFEDIAPYLVFGSGLDNQRAVTVKSTFLQNRTYLDFYYREAYTVVEMEAGPFCNAVYEISDADRYPAGEAVSFTKLPIDFGIIHYASDTPYSQARTLGARGLDYFGMDSTYASSVAIMRRILSQEGVIAG